MGNIERGQAAFYWRKTKKFLYCNHASRQEFRRNTTQRINEFLDENPGCGLDKIEEAFGAPKEYANDLMAGLSSLEVKANRHRHRFMLVGLYSLGAALLTGLVILVIYLAQAQNVTYVVKETIVYEEEVPSDFWTETGNENPEMKNDANDAKDANDASFTR